LYLNRHISCFVRTKTQRFMRKISKQLIYSGLIFCFFLLIGAYVLTAFSSIEFTLFLNSIHSPFLDHLFLWITLLGDGSLIMVLSFLLLFKKYYYSLISIILLINSGLLAYIFKKMLFVNSMRPLFYLSVSEIHIPHGIHFYYKNAFPSVHAMTVFVVASLLIWIYQNHILSYLSLLMAGLVCISRVYLLQHFFIDVYFGAILGVLETVLIIWLFETKLNWKSHSKLNSSLTYFIHKNLKNDLNTVPIKRKK